MAIKALIISDIHANVYGLRAIAGAETWDVAYCCGDVVDYGPFPMETIAWLQEHQVIAVGGNHDARLLSLSKPACEEARNGGSWMWAHDNYTKMDAAGLAYLRALPQCISFEMDGIAYQMQHQYDDGYGTIQSITEFDEFWKEKHDGIQERRLLFGHTHRRCVHYLEQKAMWINPGSTSYRRPDDRDKRAHYLIIEDGDIRFGAVEYNRQLLLKAAQDYQLADGMAETELKVAFFFFGKA